MLTPQPCSLKETHWFTELQAFATPDDIVQCNCDGMVQKDPKTGLICKEGRLCIPVASAPCSLHNTMDWVTGAGRPHVNS